MSNNNIRLFPNLTQLYMKKVSQALEDEDYAGAIEHLGKVLTLDEEHEEARRLLMELERLLKDQFKRSGAQETELVEWKQGLLQEDVRMQWSTFEKLYDFNNQDVVDLIRSFLRYSQGDMLLKTELLQECKKHCPGSWTFTVHKLGHAVDVLLEQVPLCFSEWDEQMLKPLKLLETYAHQDPTLFMLAKETWLYVLEKLYPIMPEIDEAICWTVGLHSYTLKVLNGNEAESFRQNKLMQQYGLQRSDIIDCERHFASHLLGTTFGSMSRR